jgi:hypothetical protein
VNYAKERTLRTPCNPTAETVVDDAKYTKKRPQTSLRPFVSHLSLRPSHSDSCSPLDVNERHAEATWRARIALVTHPKSVMSVEAVLDKCRFIVSHSEDEVKTRSTEQAQTGPWWEARKELSQSLPHITLCGQNSKIIIITSTITTCGGDSLQ